VLGTPAGDEGDAGTVEKDLGGIMKIRFKGNNYLLIGDLKSGGAIATEEQYANFEESYAHLCGNGNIMRYHRIIGTRDDIEVVETKGRTVQLPIIKTLTGPATTDTNSRAERLSDGSRRSGRVA
jgi:hypothetical protein